MRVKGISSIIATILMLTIVIALAGSAYVFVGGFFTSKTAQSFGIIDSYNDTLTIANDGTVAIDNMTATVDGSAVTIAVIPNIGGMIGYWSFNEGSGNKAKDGIQGLEVNLNGEWTGGRFGNAYKFIGSGWVSTNFGTGIGNGVSYVFWFKLPDTNDTSGSFFCVEDVSTTDLEDNLGQTSYGNAGCAASWTNSGFNTNDVDWHMYAFSKASVSVLCKDDSCVNLGDATGNIPSIKIIKFNGGCGCGQGNFDQGIVLDEVAIFNKNLSQNETLRLYAGLVPPRETAMVKVLSTLTKGTHTVRLCSPTMCSGGYLTII